jgi:hypothetical protein
MRTSVTTRRVFLNAAGGLAVMAAAGRGYAQSHPIELISYVTAPAPSVEAMRVFADKVAERAAGALVIDIEHKSGLSSPVRVLSQISPLSHFMSVQVRDANPLFMLSSLPMVATSPTYPPAGVAMDHRPRVVAAWVWLATGPCRAAVFRDAHAAAHHAQAQKTPTSKRAIVSVLADAGTPTL